MKVTKFGVWKGKTFTLASLCELFWNDRNFLSQSDAIDYRVVLKRYIGWIMRFPTSFAVYVMPFVIEIKRNNWCQILAFLPRS